MDNKEWFPNTTPVHTKHFYDTDIYYQLATYTGIEPNQYRYRGSWHDRQIWACPADLFRAENWSTSPYGRAGGNPSGSYGFNFYMSSGQPAYNAGSGGAAPMARINRFSDHSSYIFAGDGRRNTYDGFARVALAMTTFPFRPASVEYETDGLEFRHHRKAVHVYLDGHTGSKSIPELRMKYGYLYIGYETYR